MIVYRFSHKLYSHDLSGEGARKFGGRWNSKGFPVLYCSTSISLALLELLIHSAGYEEIQAHELITIEIPETVYTEIRIGQLKKSWQKDISYSKFIGDSFLKPNSQLLLKVPSAIIPSESNILINPLCNESKEIKIQSVETFYFDSRLFKLT